MNLHFHEILDKNNKIEITLQELELIILNTLGSNKFKWNDFGDIKRKSSIEELLRKVRVLLDNSNEVRETIRQLNREYLRLQLSIKNLEIFTNETCSKTHEIKDKLKQDSLMIFTACDESKAVEESKVNHMNSNPSDLKDSKETNSQVSRDLLAINRFVEHPGMEIIDFNSINTPVEALSLAPKTQFSNFSYQILN